MLRALGVEQAEDREVGDALARAGLAHDAERLAARSVKERPETALTMPSSVGNCDREVAHVEQQLARSRVAHARVEEGVGDVHDADS